MNVLAGVAAAVPEQLLPARSQMGFTLGVHIILVPLGVVFPLMMVIANWMGLRRNDADWLRLAERWSRVAAVTFAVGAVTGTVLSFEMGLLWPGLFDTFGDVIGVPFALEGVFFFLEAILISIYILGWRRMRPWAHFWLGVPIPIIGLCGAFTVIAANSWMNQPGGFTQDRSGDVTSVDVWSVIFNRAVKYEFPHMYFAALVAAGFLVASVYAVGLLRGRNDRYHRLGFLLPFTIAAIAIPLQMIIGDSTARAVFNDQPIKFAALELNTTTQSDAPEILLGHLNADGTVSGGLKIPGLASWLSDPKTGRDTVVTGLDSVPPEDRPSTSGVNAVHLAWDLMIGMGTALVFLAGWYAWLLWRRGARMFENRWFLRAAVAAPVGAYMAVEAGWICTEVGRQPWIVWQVLRTEDAVTSTGAGGVWAMFSAIMVLYAALAIGTVLIIRGLTKRWRARDAADDAGPPPAVPVPPQPEPSAP
ncbi:MAG TPA: cytochrome ubiquinol oxidase subunit I [Miltoncostaea sp.]|nr:cytochrome ubiquinol oxidase subunit I [Miltoncostaea sp.]